MFRKEIIPLMFFIFFTNYLTKAQIAIESNIPIELQFLKDCISTKNVRYQKYEVYTDIKYALVRQYKQKNIDLLIGIKECSRFVFKTNQSRKLFISVFEYNDSTFALKYYNEIQSLFRDSAPKEIEVDFKANFVFTFRKFLFVSYFYTEEYSKSIAKYTGKPVISVLLINKQLNNE